MDGAPSSANWSYEQGFARNEEDQWYQQSNARVEGGLLIIEGRRERVTNPNYQAGSGDLADMLNPNGQSPFRQAHYVLVNLAIGGMKGGDPSGTPFPVRYEADYVRVFQAW